VGQSLDIPRVIKDDWKRLDLIINKIKFKLGRQSSPTFSSVTLSDLVASRLVATDSGKIFESVADLTNWIVGTNNQVVVTILAGGKVTLSTPQNIHTDATPEWAGTVIKDSGDNIIFFVDDDEMYFTGGAVEIADGMCIGLLLALTYKV
jgi:hypothetical protein